MVVDWLTNFGPAWLVMIADVDIPSIIAALQAGASFGYRMIFILLILIFPLFLVQYAAGSLGIASCLGLGAAIRRFYGKRAAMMAAIPMGVTDFLEYVAEYAGIAIGLSLLGIPVLLGILSAYMIHTVVVIGKRYRQAEIILIPLSFLVVAVIAASALVFHIDIKEFLSVGLSPLQPYGEPSFDYLLAANVGAVIMPWMLYFHSGADCRREKQAKDLKNERIETLLGATVSEILMIIVVVAGIRLSGGTNLINVEELSKVLPFFGPYASLIMGMSFLFAGFLALITISLGSAWGVLEATGQTSKASFIAVYALESLPAVILVATVTGYIQLMLNLMIIYPIIIIPSLYFLGRLVSDAKVMNGHQHSTQWMMVFWVVSVLIVITGILGFASFL
jgi:Mn2+/Fe2+ NRAMP family transporter